MCKKKTLLAFASFVQEGWRQGSKNQNALKVKGIARNKNRETSPKYYEQPKVVLFFFFFLIVHLDSPREVCGSRQKTGSVVGDATEARAGSSGVGSSPGAGSCARGQERTCR